MQVSLTLLFLNDAATTEIYTHSLHDALPISVQNAGGSLVPHPDYHGRIREICDRYGVLQVADEVICGFGRLGEWFGDRKSTRLNSSHANISYAVSCLKKNR